MEWGAADVHLDAALNPALLEMEASELDTLLRMGGSGDAEAAHAVAAAVARHLAVTIPAVVDIVMRILARWRRIIARWRTLVAERKGVLLPRLVEELSDLFVEEVLRRLDPVDRTMLAQVGRPWLAAVLASRLPRLPKGVLVRLRLREFCTSAERLAWARANGCSWGDTCVNTNRIRNGRINACALAASGGHLGALRWAREHGCPWNEDTCECAAEGGHLEVLKWAHQHGCPWNGLNVARCCSGRARGRAAVGVEALPEVRWGAASLGRQ